MNDLHKRVPLFERLPEIYRIRDTEQHPPDQLKAYLSSVEQAFAQVHESIESLHNDLFIDLCDDWVIPYLADLLGTSHLSGDARTLRADVADTIPLRRRKGTREAIERLASNLTAWPCRAVELMPNLAWAQHLNHQRPDAGGIPPYSLPTLTRFSVPRGGTVPVRDPAMLSLLGSAFDPFAYTVDVKSAEDGARHINLPNLAVYLWRLSAYRIPLLQPLAKGVVDLGAPAPGSQNAQFALQFDLHPLDRPVQLFNTYQRPVATAAQSTQRLTDADGVPGPIMPARLTSGSEAGNPEAYIDVDEFDGSTVPPGGFDLADTGIQIYLPSALFAAVSWTFRGDNLCAWSDGLRRALQTHEMVIDPELGRLLIGVATASERDALMDTSGASDQSLIYCAYTYGAVGPVGAHPVSHSTSVEAFGAVIERDVTALGGGLSLQDALSNLHTDITTVVVTLQDSLVHDLDVALLGGVVVENGLSSIRLNRSLIIRAASGHKPVIRLTDPLAFRPVDPADTVNTDIIVRLEGLMLTRAESFAPVDAALIARAAVARLELDSCTLDPGGYRLRDGSRAAMMTSLQLFNDYGFANADDENDFAPTPDISLFRCETGSLLIDDEYRLSIHSSIVDAGRGVADLPDNSMAIAAATDPDNDWGAALDIQGCTVFGRTRVSEARGSGGIFVHQLEVWNHQTGCIKHSYFSAEANRLPQHHACVFASDAELVFSSHWHGDAAYGQLTTGSDFRIRYRGPADDEMGAFGFLLNSHKWINLGIRLREFMPVGVRPLLLPIT